MSKRYALRHSAQQDNQQTHNVGNAPHIEPQEPQKQDRYYPRHEQYTTSVYIGELLSRGDGWLRMTSHLDTKAFYLKFKFTRGPWRNHYVMAVCTPEQLQNGLHILWGKCNQVDLGMMKPTRDTHYDYNE